jgi:hypothetical protein
MKGTLIAGSFTEKTKHYRTIILQSAAQCRANSNRDPSSDNAIGTQHAS